MLRGGEAAMMALEWPKHEMCMRVFGAVVGVFYRRCFIDPHHEF